MPDEIMPRDRAELLWDAIINHTIEAVDAIRDRPELIAAAIAAGLPDMLGNPRDRYEMFLKAIAGSQGEKITGFTIFNMKSNNSSWYSPVLSGTIGGNKTLTVIVSNISQSNGNQNIISIGQYATDITSVNSNTAFHIVHEYTAGSVDRLAFMGHLITTAYYNIDSSEQVTIEITKSTIKVNGETAINTPAYVGNMWQNVIGENLTGYTRFGGTYDKITFA